MQVFHKLKSGGGLLKSKPDAEFADFRARLESVEESLLMLKEHLQPAESAWKNVARESHLFVSGFISNYPDEDEMRNWTRDTEKICEKLTRSLTITHASLHWKADSLVDDYISEIHSIDYKAVIAAQAEVNKYTRKLDVLRKAKSLDREKVERNEEKFDTVKSNYEAVLQPTVEKMRDIWNKAPIAFNAAFTAYWFSHVRAAQFVDHAYSDIDAFVKHHQDTFATLKLSQCSKIGLEDITKRLEHIPCQNELAVKICSDSSVLNSPVVKNSNSSPNPSPSTPTAGASAPPSAPPLTPEKEQQETVPEKPLVTSPIAAREENQETETA